MKLKFFTIAFIGTLPLGISNLISFQLGQSHQISGMLLFNLGVICIECGVLLLLIQLLRFIKEKQEKILDKIALLGMLLYTVGLVIQLIRKDTTEFQFISNNYFFNGLLINGLNTVQLPFWLTVLKETKANHIEKRQRLDIMFFAPAGTYLALGVFGLLGYLMGKHINAHILNHLNTVFCSIILILMVVYIYRKIRLMFMAAEVIER